MLNSIEGLQEALTDCQYVTARDLATVIYLSLRMHKPLFLEGEAGVGKTEVSKVLARAMDSRLIRLQCYEGLDIHNAVYQWDYARQILHLKLLEASHAARTDMEKSLYAREFLLARPLLQAIDFQDDKPPVLLIDEFDRADEEFESFLLELLSDFQITIPEIGTIRASTPPIVVITSNRTREVHDALKRRCLYHWIDYPSFETELSILKLKNPEISARLSRQVVYAVQQLRTIDLFKPPGVAETLDWGWALMAMNQTELSEEVISATLGVLLKYQDDVQTVRGVFAGKLAKETSELR